MGAKLGGWHGSAEDHVGKQKKDSEFVFRAEDGVEVAG